jgi:hypothetical protein
MVKNRCSAVGLLAIAVLLISGQPRFAFAGDPANDEDRPLRLYATALAGPIGWIAAPDATEINGKPANGRQAVWDGDFVEARHGTMTLANFDSIGRVTLSDGAAVRFASGSSDNETGGRLLVASLVRGTIAVQLNHGARAYIEAAGDRFSAHPGASFRLALRTGRASLKTLSGAVSAEVQTQRPTYKIRPVDELGRPVNLGATLSVRSRSTRNFQIQVTDENDKPIPDLPILFSLGNPCLGTLVSAGGGTSFRKNTDDRGIAGVPFISGAAAGCIGSLIAKVEGTNVEFSQEISVQQKNSFWTTRNSLLLAGAIGAVAIGTAFAIAADDGSPITPVPPPTVRP